MRMKESTNARLARIVLKIARALKLLLTSSPRVLSSLASLQPPFQELQIALEYLRSFNSESYGVAYVR